MVIVFDKSFFPDKHPLGDPLITVHLLRGRSCSSTFSPVSIVNYIDPNRTNKPSSRT